MTMTPITKRIVVLGTALAIVSIGIVSYLLIQIDGQGKRLDENIQIIREAQSQKEAQNRLAQVFEESASDRQVLKAAMLENPTDGVIEFVTYLENFAREVGIDFTIISLGAETPVKDVPGTTQMRLEFDYEGTREAVLGFSNLLENVPYLSYLESLALTAGDAGLYDAKVVLVLTLRTI